MKYLFVLAAGLLSLSACASTTGSGSADETSAEAKKEDDMICRSVRVAGSNIPERVCRPAD